MEELEEKIRNADKKLMESQRRDSRTSNEKVMDNMEKSKIITFMCKRKKKNTDWTIHCGRKF